MKESIEQKLDRVRKMARETARHAPKDETPAKHDSLSRVIRTKEDAAVFMAQLDALTLLARQEYLEREKKATS